MHIQELDGKKVCILGFGREGRAMVEAIERYAPTCEITIADKSESIEPTNRMHWFQLGTGWLQNLEKFDLIIKSPGIPPDARLETLSPRLTSSTQIFFDTIAGTGAMIVGVTGSKGKSTTSSLIESMLRAGKRDVHLIGNIGKPAISFIDDAKPDTIFVFEMSSFQLMNLTVSPHIAVITSFFPEHLDYHGSIEAYQEAKKHITRFQNKDDIVFYNSDSTGATEIANESTGIKKPFSASDSPVILDEIKLIGQHNLSNIAGAFAVTMHLGIERETAVNAIKAFEGLPHRLQRIGIVDGIDWIDDAISTTPESAIAALEALGGRVQTVILGGQDRGYDFSSLALALQRSGVKQAILFPGSGQRIRQAIEETQHCRIDLHDATSMKEAVTCARAVTETGAICLLSTASPSYGMFKNFEDKGDQFQHYVTAA